MTKTSKPSADSPDSAARTNDPGTVYLIGAGPGDPGLLTLRGAELLAACDVVLYDGLSNPAILRHAPHAVQICVGKHGQSRIWQQDEINQEMLTHARAGRSVARLKGGDPAVFARTAEEAEALRDAGIPFEIVPGITAALAAGSYAGIPITHRRYASAVALVTGQEEPNKAASSLDWDALARFPGTLVVYMGVTTAEAWTKSLIGAGKPPETPVAIIRRCSLPDQQRIHCRLDEVTERLTPPAGERVRPPVIVIVGKVTELADTLAWFDCRPLFGQRILVTRPADQADALAAPLRRRGADVSCQPAIEITPPSDWHEVDAAIDDVRSGDTIVFNSRNGVRFFLDRVWERGADWRRFGGVRLATVGAKTADALAEYRFRADIIPSEFHAESLLETLQKESSGQRFLVVRASRGRDVLAPALRQAGNHVRQIAAYQNCDVTEPDPEILRQLADQQFDWITVTSSAIAESLDRMFGDHLRSAKLVSMSPITSETLRQLGHSVAAEASPHTVEGIVQAIETHTTRPAEP